MPYKTGYTCSSLEVSSQIDIGIVFAPNTSEANAGGTLELDELGDNVYNSNGQSPFGIPESGIYQVTFKLTTSGDTDNTEVTEIIFGLSSQSPVVSSSVLCSIPIYAGGTNTYNAPYWYTTYMDFNKGNVWAFIVRSGNNNDYTVKYEIYLNQPTG